MRRNSYFDYAVLIHCCDYHHDFWSTFVTIDSSIDQLSVRSSIPHPLVEFLRNFFISYNRHRQNLKILLPPPPLPHTALKLTFTFPSHLKLPYTSPIRGESSLAKLPVRYGYRTWASLLKLPLSTLHTYTCHSLPQIVVPAVYEVYHRSLR